MSIHLTAAFFSYLIILLAILAAYCCGSLSSAILISKAMGLTDPRTAGSGNPGATNVLRLGGKKAAAAVLIGDILKGWLPVILAKLLGLSTLSVGLVALAAFLGHLYPLFFRFQGGKGVATAFGCLTGFSPALGLALIGTWVCTALVFRYSSLAALVTAALAPFFSAYFTNPTMTLITCIMSVLLIFRHKKNIYNLLHKKESRIGEKKTSSS